MDPQLIPKTLHHLIPLVEKYGIGDDGYRCELIESLQHKELEYLVNSFSNTDADILNAWLTRPNADIQSVEYEKMSSFFMAFEYAEVILKNR